MKYLSLLALLFLALSARSAEPEKPKLLVLVVFDQMRGDYIGRWMHLCGKDGFRRLTGDGAWYDNCHYPYAFTYTGPGHASILSGTCPDKHGIINNSWYDRKTRTSVNCAASERYDRVPPYTKRFPPEKKEENKDPEEDGKARGNPDLMMSPTVGDVLKDSTAGKGKIFGLSFKDRSALLPGGKKPDGVYWMDNADGMLVTSTFYRSTPHAWIAKLNASHFADQWFDKPWDRYLMDADYAKLCGPDDVKGESSGTKQGRVFPHAMNGGKPALSKAYFDALFCSPFGNELMLEAAKTAIVEEQLGRHADTDLLTISFSSNDSVGHAYGPDSQEVMDVTLRSDRIVAQLLGFLDEKVGKGNYLLALTADHGVCPLPEVSAAKGLGGKRVPSKDVFGELEPHLVARFGAIPPRAKWVESSNSNYVYINQKLVADKGLTPAKVEQAVADFLKDKPGVQKLYTRTEIMAGDFKDDPVGRMLKRSFHPERSGDVALILKPYHLMTSATSGTTHGSPHPYDTHVPLVFFGWKTEAGVRKDKATPQSIAAVFAKALGVPKPRDAEFDVPTPVWK